MTIKEVCDKYGITADTLRYYERVGVIPTVGRTKGGIRDYADEDIKWVENAICMRNAGMPVEMLIEYTRPYKSRLLSENPTKVSLRQIGVCRAEVGVLYWKINCHGGDRVLKALSPF